MAENDENGALIKHIVNKPPMGGLRKGILANKDNYDKQMKDVNPQTVPNRLGLIVDDSSSMGHEGMENVHKAVKGFTNNCNPLDTSIAIYPLNRESKILTCDYDLINLYVMGLWASGGTPIYDCLISLIDNEKITRAVLFSDGEPTDGTCLKDEKETNDTHWYGRRDMKKAFDVIDKYKAKETCVDTIYIGLETSQGYTEMKTLAELTGGTFIHFKDSSSLASGLKYLAPKYRALLANPDIKARIERGETV